jgi:hypothetical protein
MLPTEMADPVFSNDFLLALKTLVNVHHSIYRESRPPGLHGETRLFLMEQYDPTRDLPAFD